MSFWNSTSDTSVPKRYDRGATPSSRRSSRPSGVSQREISSIWPPRASTATGSSICYLSEYRRPQHTTIEAVAVPVSSDEPHCASDAAPAVRSGLILHEPEWRLLAGIGGRRRQGENMLAAVALDPHQRTVFR